MFENIHLVELNPWIGVLFVMGLATIIGLIMIFVGALIRPNKPNKYKESIYESGMLPVGEAHINFHVRYYIIAILFVLFDVETLFLIPWAVAFDSLGTLGLFEAIVFIVILFVGYVYAWGKGFLNWQD